MCIHMHKYINVIYRQNITTYGMCTLTDVRISEGEEACFTNFCACGRGCFVTGWTSLRWTEVLVFTIIFDKLTQSALIFLKLASFSIMRLAYN